MYKFIFLIRLKAIKHIREPFQQQPHDETCGYEVSPTTIV